MSHSLSQEAFLAQVASRNPHQPEFIQAVSEVIARLLTVTRGDGTSTLGHRIDSIGLARGEAEKYALFDMYYPLMFPLQDGAYEIEAVDHATKKPTMFAVLAMTKAERTEEMARRYGPPPSFDDGWRFEIRDGATGYLKGTWKGKTWLIQTASRVAQQAARYEGQISGCDALKPQKFLGIF